MQRLSSASRTIPKQRFLLIYADRSRAHIDIHKRDSMLISKEITKVNDFTYEYTAKPLISRAFNNLERIKEHFQTRDSVHKNLGIGTLVFKLRDSIEFDNGETAEGMQIRMATA